MRDEVVPEFRCRELDWDDNRPARAKGGEKAGKKTMNVE
jgi:hypothetical protein